MKKSLLLGVVGVDGEEDKLQDLSTENRIKCKQAIPGHSQSISKSQYDKINSFKIKHSEPYVTK